MWLAVALVGCLCAAGCGRDILPVDGFQYATTAERSAAQDAVVDAGDTPDTAPGDATAKDTIPQDTTPQDAGPMDGLSSDANGGDAAALDADSTDSTLADGQGHDGGSSDAKDVGPSCTPATAAKDCDDGDPCTQDLCADGGTCKYAAVTEACCVGGQLLDKGKKCGSSAVKSEYKCSPAGLGSDVMTRAAWGSCDGASPTCDEGDAALIWGAWTTHKDCAKDQVCEVAKVNIAGKCVQAPSALKLCGKPDKYEAGTSPDTAVSVGAFKDNSKATVIDPDLLMGANDDVDWVKYTLSDAVNLFNPRVEIGWTASDVVEVCAWFACSKGSGGKNCLPVKCDKGGADHNPKVSGTVNNGCCAAGKAGGVRFNPKSGATNDGGVAYVRVRNLAKTCQYVNTKLIFANGETACGDGAGTDCNQDKGSCVGKCGKYDAAKPCQCDSGCVAAKDCCWDWNLNCL